MPRDTLSYERPDAEPGDQRQPQLDHAFVVVCGTLGISMTLLALICLPIARGLNETFLAVVGAGMLLFCLPGLIFAFRSLHKSHGSRLVGMIVLALNAIPFFILAIAYFRIV